MFGSTGISYLLLLCGRTFVLVPTVYSFDSLHEMTVRDGKDGSL